VVQKDVLDSPRIDEIYVFRFLIVVILY